jgi:hypothetical protein
MSNTATILQLKLTLADSVPEVWRRIQVPSDFTLGDFHYLILYAFCWFDDRPHEFLPSSEAPGTQAVRMPCEPVDEDAILLSDVLRGRDAQMRYRCEFGDQWAVDVLAEAQHAPVRGHRYPYCSSGKHDGPPDGVGGISSYNEVVEAFARPGGPEALFSRPDHPEWLQPFFDPTYLDIGLINMLLDLIFPAEEQASGLDAASDANNAFTGSRDGAITRIAHPLTPRNITLN